MKKRNNKVLALTLIGIVFVTLLGIFILNYSKDDASFSILEKKWINDNKREMVDISVFNDVPIFGNNGTGVLFDFLDDVTSSYGINFNKVPYVISDSNVTLKNNSFKIVDNNTDLSNKDILIYEDHYVLVGKDSKSIHSIKQIGDMKIAVLSNDIGLVSNYLTDNNLISYVSKDNINDIETSISDGSVEGAIIPYDIYFSFILKNDLHVLFHLTDINKKYVLSVDNNTFYNILRKAYSKFKKEKQSLSYKENFLNEYFLDKNISEADRIGYNSAPYNVGYTTYMPLIGVENKMPIGILSNYYNNFEDIYDVDFNYIYYDSVEKLKKDFSNGELDVVFGNFNTNGLNIDVIETGPLFDEEYVVISKNVFDVTSIKSLIGKEVLVVKDTYLNDLISSMGISYKAFINTDELLRSVSNDSIIVMDKATYDYYKIKKFSNFNELYRGTLPNTYSFYVRKVDKNIIFSEMFSYYVESVNYNSMRFNYNTNLNNYSSSSLLAFVICLLAIIVLFVLFIVVRKKKKRESILTNNDKLKYIDAMTSLKNRNYLNLKIKEWDNNNIYPQSFVIVDLNNIKYINDNHGHEEGDTVIKKAASILIVNQESNTDIIRTDGNEFLVYMVGYDEKSVVNYTRKIYKELKALPYGFGASIGYSMIMDDIKTVDDAINEATIDMRNNKNNMNGNNN